MSDARATARQHTAQLLKMLRGYGPTPTPAPAVTESKPVVIEPVVATIAEAPSAYTHLREAAPLRTLLPPLEASPAPVLQPRERSRVKSAPSFMPTVGEGLRCLSSGVLGKMVARVDDLNRLGRIFCAYLPSHLHDHAVLIRMDQEGWEVHADSASWATRLRYALPNIRPMLGEHLGLDLPKPRIRVRPVITPPQQPRRSRLTLTQDNADLLEATARNLADARLGAALLRLAANARPAAETAAEEESSRG